MEDDEISPLKLTAKALNGWLQDDPFGASLAHFQGLCLPVSFKEGRFPSDSFVIWGAISWDLWISGCTDSESSFAGGIISTYYISRLRIDTPGAQMTPCFIKRYN